MLREDSRKHLLRNIEVAVAQLAHQQPFLGLVAGATIECLLQLFVEVVHGHAAAGIGKCIIAMISRFIIGLILAGAVSCVLYSVDANFKVSLQQSPTELAHCHYVEKIRESGWNRMYVQGNAAADMLQQYRAGGFCEGYASYKEIFYAYNNYVKSLALNGSFNVNVDVKRFQDEQLIWLDQMAAKFANELYWQQARGILIARFSTGVAVALHVSRLPAEDPRIKSSGYVHRLQPVLLSHRYGRPRGHHTRLP